MWVLLVFDVLGTGTTSRVYVLTPCITQLTQIHAERTQTPLVKGRKVLKSFNLLSLIWYKMCWLKGDKGSRRGEGEYSKSNL